MWFTILFLLLLVFAAVKSVLYLATYLKLIKNGTRTKAQIISIQNAGFIIIRHAAIPIIRFSAAENTSITGKPIYSWMVELNQYMHGQSRIVYYDKSKPDLFVVKSNTELITNFAMILVAIIGILWFVWKEF